MYDVIIIGAGIVGSLTARNLSRYALKILLIEQHYDVACGATKANSGLIHAGYDSPAQTVMGKMCLRGNELYTPLSQELAFDFERVGSLVIAMDEKERDILYELKQNGDELGVKGLEIVEREWLLERVPRLTPACVAALYAPSAGIVLPWEVAVAACENAIDNGVTLKLDTQVRQICKTDIGYLVNGEFEGKCLINCAGVHADEVELITHGHTDYTITPRIGEYYLLDRAVGNMTPYILFQCPNDMGKGTIIAPTVDKNVIIGPNAVNVSKEDQDAVATTADGLRQVYERAKILIPEIPIHMNIANFAGVRAHPSTHDFILKREGTYIAAAGIKSPGLTSAPAIAEWIESEVKAVFGEGILLNEAYDPYRRPRPRMDVLSWEERVKRIEEDPSFGKIICRCEHISEGEIRDAIRRSCGARSVNGVKRRVRPGAGRCQGGFCGPKIMQILSKELGISVEDVLLEDLGSQVIMRGVSDESI